MIISNDEMQRVLNAIGDVELAEKIEAIFEEHNERHRVGRVDIEDRKGIVLAALHECVSRQCLGSLGNEEASQLYHELKYEDYCVEHGITYEEMDEYDIEAFYEKEAKEREMDCENEPYCYENYEY